MKKDQFTVQESLVLTRFPFYPSFPDTRAARNDRRGEVRHADMAEHRSSSWLPARSGASKSQTRGECRERVWEEPSVTGR